MLDEKKEKKFVVYRGSIYSQMRDPNALWIMSEREWDSYDLDTPKNATLVARGLTQEVAKKMIYLAKDN